MCHIKSYEVQHRFSHWIRDQSRILNLKYTQSCSIKLTESGKQRDDPTIFDANAQAVDVNLFWAA